MSNWLRRSSGAQVHTKTDLVLDALKQVLWAQGEPRSVTHHSDRGNRYLSIRYFENAWRTQAPVGSVNDFYDNVLAETINNLYRAEIIHKNGPGKGLETVKWGLGVY